MSHPPDMPPKTPLTLVVAATKQLGIGQSGKLPWPSLPTEMGYFRRVTTRLPPSTPQPAQNAVIMGRKTWDSIPPKFRPLKDRINVVVTRSGTVEGLQDARAKGRVVVVASLEEGLQKLDGLRKEEGLGEAFVIGGSTLYQAALELSQTKRVLLTKILKEFECDTFLSLDFEGEEGVKAGWKRRSWDELEQYAGADVVKGVEQAKSTYHGEGRVTEGDVEFEFCLFERD